MSLQDRFLQDLKRSWQKTALLGVLFVIGLYFWVPPLLKQFGGSSTKPTASALTSRPANGLNGADSADQDQGDSAEPGWQQIDSYLTQDQLYVSVDVSDKLQDPFVLDQDQFRPPALFAAESDDKPDRIAPPVVADNSPPVIETLELKSTFLGRNRRAAYINRKLYFEGMQVSDGTNWWRIESIQARRVVLNRGEQQIELQIRQRPDSTPESLAAEDKPVPDPRQPLAEPDRQPPP